jgi:hypothetical protein
MSITVPLEDNYEAILTQAVAASASALTLYVSKTPVFTMPAGREVVVTIDPGRGFLYQENCLMESYDAVNKTITLKAAGRAQLRYAGDAPTALPHAVGAKVIISDNYLVWEQLNDYLPLAGGILTGALQFDDALTQVIHKLGDLYFKSDLQAEISLSALASLSGVNDKVKISAADTTEGYLNAKINAALGLTSSITNPAGNEVLKLDIDLADANVFSATGASGKVPLGGLTGELDPSWIPAINPEVGTSAASITNKDVLIQDATGRMTPADADAIATTFNLGGIAASAAVGANASVDFIPPGPVAPIAALAMAEYGNAVLTALTPSNTTVDTATDAPTAIAERRAQTFTASTNTWEDNLVSATLYLTKTGSPSGNSVVYLHATSGNLPISSVSQVAQAASDTTDALANANHWRAQTFTPAAGGYISSANIYLSKVGAPGGNSTLYLRAVVAGVPSGGNLATATVVANAGISTGVVAFTFPTPYLLTAGTTYALVYSPGTVSAGNTLSWDYQNSDIYAGGNSAHCTDGGTTWTADAFDRRFEVFYNGELGRATVANASIATGANTFTFATPVALTPGTVYALVYEAGGTSGGNVIAWSYNNGDVYAGGQSAHSHDSGQNWTAEATWDRYFTMKYGALYGCPAFISSTTGAITLSPYAAGSGKYNKRIGYILSRTKLILERGLRSIYATYNFTADATVNVDTEITLGFRPFLVFAALTAGSGRGSNGMWMSGGVSFSTENKNSGVESNAATGYFGLWSVNLANWSGINLGTDANYMLVALDVTATSANTITIRRTCVETGAGSSYNMTAYLNIIGW